MSTHRACRIVGDDQPTGLFSVTGPDGRLVALCTTERDAHRLTGLLSEPACTPANDAQRVATWTHERPTECGFYWHRRAPGMNASIVEVYDDTGRPVVFRMGRDERPVYLDQWHGEWAGPIPAPAEARP